ncbi:hypothetical protein KR767_15850 [Luteibacter anthropi]|uniref:hypothetical protein n=1 Tax=Luteibacter anthropi TaxID=564369 RepID=UPI002032CC83|nr:hypothetical protein [Luteibacter anthropi]URX61524.1 hypothetical protein KR767_15850 [Luteibacter anthropi]
MRRFRLNRRKRLLTIGLALFCLLFQQLALAAYACSPAAANAMAMQGECAQMSAPSRQAPDPACTSHCADHSVSPSTAQLPSLPPLALPAMPPVLEGSIALAPESQPLPDPTFQRPEPPPALRFCSLLI